MFGIGSAEMFVIFIIALIVLGPNKLPGIFKAIGKGISEFRQTIAETDREEPEEKNDTQDGKKSDS